MKKQLKSLHGILESNSSFLKRWKDQERCELRLTLFDLPLGGLLVVTTEYEVIRTRQRFSGYRTVYGKMRYHLRIFPDRQPLLSFVATLEMGGHLDLAIYAPKVNPVKDEALHWASYHVDYTARRPVRRGYHKLLIHVEEEWREQPPRHVAPMRWPEGSLFISLHNSCV